MKFSLDSGSARYQIQGYRSGEHVVVNRHVYSESLILSPDVLRPWPPRCMDDLTAAHFALLLEFKPRYVLFGSGARFQFPPAACLQDLYQQGISVEVMDTGAACRTYAVLTAEGRPVVAALLI